jgi:hypothetical protein
MPVNYRAQSPDTDRHVDWLLFEHLRQMPEAIRHQRFRTFNLTWRQRLWWLCKDVENPTRSYLQRRYGADWLNSHSSLNSRIPMIIDPITFALKVASILEPLNIPYYVGGSVASSLHGESRGTRDIDLAIEIDINQVEGLIQAFVDADFYISETSVLEAVESTRHDRSFNVIDNASSEKADIFPLKSEPFARSKMARRQSIEFPEGAVWVCSAEDIILQKLRWRQSTSSTEQWNDVLGVMKLQQGNLDLGYLQEWAPQVGVASDLERALREAGID